MLADLHGAGSQLRSEFWHASPDRVCAPHTASRSMASAAVARLSREDVAVLAGVSVITARGLSAGTSAALLTACLRPWCERFSSTRPSGGDRDGSASRQ